MTQLTKDGLQETLARLFRRTEKILVAELVTAGNYALKEATTAISARGQGNEKTV